MREQFEGKEKSDRGGVVSAEEEEGRDRWTRGEETWPLAQAGV